MGQVIGDRDQLKTGKSSVPMLNHLKGCPQWKGQSPAGKSLQHIDRHPSNQEISKKNVLLNANERYRSIFS